MKYQTIILAFLLLIFFSCEKNEPDNANITTIEVNNITAYSAECRSEIPSDGKLSILSRGVCWGKSMSPTLNDSYSIDSNGFGSFLSEVIDLNANNTYYVRAYYINSRDTIYGNQIEFKTLDYIQFAPDLEYGTVTDIDGNVYKTIQIGEQTWMAENLRTTRYQNGDSIAHVTNLNKWWHFQIGTGAYIYYDNDESNKDIYGALYNWYAASDNRHIAPVGWHVPTVEDWKELIDYLDPFKNENYGHKLRESTTAHWYFDGQMRRVSINSTGFTSIPSGKAVPEMFMDMGGYWAYYWTGTGTLDGSNCVYLADHISIDCCQPNARGFSIRCVKD